MRLSFTGAACAALGICLLLAGASPSVARTRHGLARDVRHHVVRARVTRAGDLPYGGGPVLHSNRTHLIFWEPSGSGLSFEPGYEALIESFMRNVAAASRNGSNVYGLTGQYTDARGPATYVSRYGGAVIATDRLPPNGCTEPPVVGPGWSDCLTDLQLQREIEHVVRADHLPLGANDVYFLVTPNGLGNCEDSRSSSCALGGQVSGYCGYHSQTDDGLVLYAVIPYNAVSGHCQSDNPRPNGSAADPAISTISHEHSEMITDPVGTAWIDPRTGNEDGDMCLTSFGPTIGGSGNGAWNEMIGSGRYYLQEEWSNRDGSCRPRAKADFASFTAALPASRVSWLFFLARAYAPQGSIVSYRWFFGDGRTGGGRVSSHHYRRPARYRVVLRTTDSWGNWAFYARTITVRPGSARVARVAKSG